MKVVSDSSPLHYLILIEATDVLPALFQRVYVPGAVCGELLRARAPGAVRQFMQETPAWIERDWATARADTGQAATLGAGEREAIALARTFQPEELLLIDESRGRRVAEGLGIRFVGVLGVLDRAAAKGLLDLPTALGRLVETSFYVKPGILRMLLEHDEKRRQS